jgi:hypothetical protein
MDQLLALNNIKTVHFLDRKDTDHCYSFTSKMAAKDIFIEYYNVEFDENEEIEDDEELEQNEDQDNDQEFEEDGDFSQYGSQLSVVMKYKSRYYQFVMYDNAHEIGVPLMLLQTIIFIVKLIEEAKPDQLVEYLTSLSTNPLIPHEIPDADFREVAKEMIKLKIKTIHQLIREEQAGLN